MRALHFIRRVLKYLGGLLLLLIALLLLAALLPMKQRFSAPWQPASADYQASKAALEKLFATVPSTLSAAGHPRAFLHEQPTDQVFVLLHGLTSAPEQFDELGRQLFDRGANVIIPLTPGHGETDLMTGKLGTLTAQEMLTAANDALNIAHGLGRHVTVVGLSVNGTTAAWLAQNRADVDCAILLAPFFAPKGLPEQGIAPLSHLLIRLPNLFFWWDSKKKEAFGGPPYSYPRFATKSIGETLLLGLNVFRDARKSPPACHSILVVTTASDGAANNEVTARLVSDWKAQGAQGIQTYEFPKSEKVPHDFIDPHQPDQQIAIVYPRLIDALFHH